jgi:hypothetical protein
MRLEKNVLQEVLGVRFAARHPKQQAEEPGRVRAVELLEGGHVAPPAASGQIEVGRMHVS